jgi:PPK2 family polyphosphate:nucleotide phosphotransferase
MAARSVRELLRVDPGAGSTALAGIDPSSTPGVKGKSKAKAAFARDAEALADWQERLYAEERRSVLLVLQGMDASGKDGTVKHVIGAMNPQGCRITTFKAPTAEELRHHFLWRVRRALPPPRHVGIFNRSHYEDVLIVRVHGLVAKGVWGKRYDEINRFEEKVAESGTVIVKVMLHISFDEQRERLLARLDDPTKRWKFNPDDLAERARWTEYQQAYEDVLERCSTEVAPWYVVPADRKWYRNWAVTRLLIETLEHMAPQYPEPTLDVDPLKARLAPPG